MSELECKKKYIEGIQNTGSNSIMKSAQIDIIQINYNVTITTEVGRTSVNHPHYYIVT